MKNDRPGPRTRVVYGTLAAAHCGCRVYASRGSSPRLEKLLSISGWRAYAATKFAVSWTRPGDLGGLVAK